MSDVRDEEERRTREDQIPGKPAETPDAEGVRSPEASETQSDNLTDSPLDTPPGERLAYRSSDSDDDLPQPEHQEIGSGVASGDDEGVRAVAFETGGADQVVELTHEDIEQLREQEKIDARDAAMTEALENKFSPDFPPTLPFDRNHSDDMLAVVDQAEYADKKPWPEAQTPPDSLNTYESLQSDDGPAIDPERLSIDEDEKLDNLHSSLSEIRELRPDEWHNLDDTERQQAVEQGVEAISREYGIEPPDVEVMHADSHLQGYYNPENHTLYLNQSARSQDGSAVWEDPSIVMETAAHETRHAYQHAAVRDFEQGRVSDQRASEWLQNFKGSSKS